MMAEMPFEVKDVDRAFYAEHLTGFLPSEIIDIHSHVWLKDFLDDSSIEARGPEWPALVAEDNSIEDLFQTYGLMFPQRKVTPLVFGLPRRDIDLGRSNKYASRVAREHHLPSLIVSLPEWSADELERRVRDGGFLGLKPYLAFAPAHVAGSDITIFDFLPHHHLEVANAHGYVPIRQYRSLTICP